MPDSAPFADFAAALADVAETAGRHDKADRLGAFLADLADDDLRLAARWAAGRVFSLSDQRTVSVGFSALRKATAQATGADPDDLAASLVRLGDPGDVAAAALDAPGPARPADVDAGRRRRLLRRGRRHAWQHGQDGAHRRRARPVDARRGPIPGQAVGRRDADRDAGGRRRERHRPSVRAQAGRRQARQPPDGRRGRDGRARPPRPAGGRHAPDVPPDQVHARHGRRGLRRAGRSPTRSAANCRRRSPSRTSSTASAPRPTSPEIPATTRCTA